MSKHPYPIWLRGQWKKIEERQRKIMIRNMLIVFNILKQSSPLSLAQLVNRSCLCEGTVRRILKVLTASEQVRCIQMSFGGQSYRDPAKLWFSDGFNIVHWIVNRSLLKPINGPNKTLSAYKLLRNIGLSNDEARTVLETKKR